MATFPRGHHAFTVRVENARKIARGEAASPTPHVSRGFEFPDPVDLRGVPCAGRGVSGAIRGTRPGDGLR